MGKSPLFLQENSMKVSNSIAHCEMGLVIDIFSMQHWNQSVGVIRSKPINSIFVTVQSDNSAALTNQQIRTLEQSWGFRPENQGNYFEREKIREIVNLQPTKLH